MRRPRGKRKWERRVEEWLKVNAPFRRYVLRELERRGPLLTRELEDRSVQPWGSERWWGTRNVNVLLEVLHGRGEVAIVGRRGVGTAPTYFRSSAANESSVASSRSSTASRESCACSARGGNRASNRSHWSGRCERLRASSAPNASTPRTPRDCPQA